MDNFFFSVENNPPQSKLLSLVDPCHDMMSAQEGVSDEKRKKGCIFLALKSMPSS